MQALSGMIGRKASVGAFKSAVKSRAQPWTGGGETTKLEYGRGRGISGGATAGDKPEEGEDDVKSSCPLCPGRHTCYNGRDKGSRSREVGELTPKTRPQFGCRLQLACMKPESLVIAGQPYGG
ncbi:Photosystem II CP47 reaction center protein [Quillaja saponaria]|uniref:Photosystem II CP47 reaction center protein n=1 Tax=Quillaja saponaria TaxID=32244 RepID=A0AAD7KK62_QUISA|nr:Photosystem II CP47 reaction center protein [Quillaja saponaria]